MNRKTAVAGLSAALAMLLATLLPAQTSISIGAVSLATETDGQSFPIAISGGTAIAGMDFLLKVEGGATAPRITSVKLVDAATVWGPGGSSIGLAQGDAQTIMCGVYTGSTVGATVPAAGTLAVVTVDTTGVAPGEYPVSLSVNGHQTRIYAAGGTRVPLTLSGGTLIVAGIPTTYPLTVTNGTGSGNHEAAAIVPVAANAAPDGQEFAAWTGDTAHLADALAAETTVTMPAAAVAITATYQDVPPPPADWTVTFVALAGGEIDGTAVQGVADGGDCTSVEALAQAGFTFTGWTGDVVSADNPLTVTEVTTDMTIYANFAADEKVAAGSVFEVEADEIEGVAAFTKAPKVWALYHDPFKDPFAQGKAKKAATKTLTKIPKGGTSPNAFILWKKKVRLYDAKALKGEQKLDGITTAAWLADNPVGSLNMALHAAGKEDGKAYDTQKLLAQSLRTVALAGPTLVGVRDQADENDLISLADQAGQEIILRGNWFGTKPPKAWLEYRTAEGAIKCLKLKVVKEFIYENNGVANAGVMNQLDPQGASEMRVLLPAVLPERIAAVVIENGVGIDAYSFLLR